MHKSHARPGRPPKYGRAARAVTVTLPEDVLTRLSAVHADLGRAIVSLAERTARHARRRPAPPAEVAPYGKRAVIVVNPARALKQLPGVELVPTANGRALISLDPEYSIAHFELNLRDALEGNHISGHERALLRDISGILHQARQSARTHVKARTIIVLEHKRRRKRV